MIILRDNKRIRIGFVSPKLPIRHIRYVIDRRTLRVSFTFPLGPLASPRIVPADSDLSPRKSPALVSINGRKLDCSFLDDGVELFVAGQRLRERHLFDQIDTERCALEAVNTFDCLHKSKLFIDSAQRLVFRVLQALGNQAPTTVAGPVQIELGLGNTARVVQRFSVRGVMAGDLSSHRLGERTKRRVRPNWDVQPVTQSILGCPRLSGCAPRPRARFCVSSIGPPLAIDGQEGGPPRRSRVSRSPKSASWTSLFAGRIAEPRVSR